MVLSDGDRVLYSSNVWPPSNRPGSEVLHFPRRQKFLKAEVNEST